MYMYLDIDNLKKPIEYQGHWSNVKATHGFRAFFVCMILRLPADST